MTLCPFIGIQIEGRRPLVIERRKYDTVTRKINVTSERVEQLPSGSYALVIEHATGNVKGKYRFNDCTDYLRYGRNAKGFESVRKTIFDWAERRRESRTKPKLDARGRLMASLAKEACGWNPENARVMLASLQEAA